MALNALKRSSIQFGSAVPDVLAGVWVVVVRHQAHVADAVVDVSCGEGTNTVLWLANVAIALYDKVSSKGYLQLGERSHGVLREVGPPGSVVNPCRAFGNSAGWRCVTRVQVEPSESSGPRWQWQYHSQPRYATPLKTGTTSWWRPRWVRAAAWQVARCLWNSVSCFTARADNPARATALQLLLQYI